MSDSKGVRFSKRIALLQVARAGSAGVSEVCDPQVVDHKYGSGLASRTSRQSRGFVASNQHRFNVVMS